MIIAYYNCVNANGGVNGHPVKLFVEYDQTQPAQVAAAAKKLIQTDHVVGIVGVFDLLECTVDQSYWKQLGIYEMGAGIAPECWSTPNSAAVNMGPRYSSDGAVQYGLSQHPSKVVFVQSNVPGTGYIAAGPAALAKAAGVPITALTENVPINDASSVGDVLQRRPELLRRVVAVGLVVQLHLVPVGIGELIGRTVAVIALDPADPEPRALDRGYSAFECLRAPGADRHVPDPR